MNNPQLTMDELFKVVSETPGTIDMTNIFPDAGVYFVEASEAIPGINRNEPDHPRPYARVPVSIIAVDGKPESGLKGREFSLFFSLDKVKSPKSDKAPISFTARALYRLEHGKFPPNGKTSENVIKKQLEKINGARLVVSRSTYIDTKGELRSRDTLISSEEWKEKAKLDGTPEADPELIAAEMTI